MSRVQRIDLSKRADGARHPLLGIDEEPVLTVVDDLGGGTLQPPVEAAVNVFAPARTMLAHGA